MVAAQLAARLGLFHELLQVLRAADAVLFADVKQRDPAREVLRHGGLLFLGGKVAGLFPGCKAVCTLGFIDAQPLAHGGVADADALRRGLAADLACFDFFHKRDLLLWRQLWSLGHGEHLKRVRSEELGVKSVQWRRGEHCSPAERSGSRKVPGSMTSIDPYSVGADSISARKACHCRRRPRLPCKKTVPENALRR